MISIAARLTVVAPLLPPKDSITHFTVSGIPSFFRAVCLSVAENAARTGFPTFTIRSVGFSFSAVASKLIRIRSTLPCKRRTAMPGRAFDSCTMVGTPSFAAAFSVGQHT